MISNNDELQTAMKRIERFQNQLAYLHKTETNPANTLPRHQVIDRIQLEDREYLRLYPAEIQPEA